MTDAFARVFDADHGRRVAFLFGLDVTATTPVTLAAPPTRATDRLEVWSDIASDTHRHGLALVPLDVQPGDHMLHAVREQAVLHMARHGGDLDAAVRAVLSRALAFTGVGKTTWREWLEQVQDALDTGAPWSARLTRADLNPGPLVDLVGQARSVGLDWLCDARLANTSLVLLPRVARAFADDDMARTGDRLRGEQLADLVRNQVARVGLFLRGRVPPRPAVDLDRVRALSWVKDDPCWASWALEALDGRAQAELQATDTPPATEAVVRALASAVTPWSVAALREFTGQDDQAVSAALVAAWALGFASPAGPLP